MPISQPGFDLVVATVDRTDELARLLDSLERQTYRSFRLLVVDQNEDDRVTALLEGLSFPRLQLRSPRGLSRARNAALPLLLHDIVAFPDDDCVYPDDLLERLDAIFVREPRLDGLTGRAVGEDGRSSDRWPAESMLVERRRVWHAGISFTIFLRRQVVERVGPFDERLGLGSGNPWSSGEEIDYLVRALDAGASIRYDPAIVVVHDLKEQHDGALRALGLRDGGSVGFLLRKHRYPPRTVARMLVRPLGGALVALLRGDLSRSRFHLATLRGRVAGYRAGARPA